MAARLKVCHIANLLSTFAYNSFRKVLLSVRVYHLLTLNRGTINCIIH